MCATADAKPKGVDEPETPPDPRKAEADPVPPEGDEPGYGHGV